MTSQRVRIPDKNANAKPAGRAIVQSGALSHPCFQDHKGNSCGFGVFSWEISQ